MFKSRHRYYRKFRRLLPLWVVLLAIPIVLILLELLLRFFILITGNTTKLATYQGVPAIANAYCLKFVGQERQPYQGLSDRGLLAAQQSLAGGYSLVGNQKSDFWQINEQGFRDDAPVPLAKPKNEIRIFLLGGSAAFGQWNESNQATIASKLEAHLNERVAQQKRSPNKYRPTTLPVYKPDLDKAMALPPRIREGKYRAIAAAVPGYASGNELAQLALQILPYSPDAILVLDGYADLMLPSDEFARDIPHIDAFLSNATGHFGTHFASQLKHALTDTYFVKAIQYWLLKPQLNVNESSLTVTERTAPLEQQLADDPIELERRVERYRQHLKQMVGLLAGSKIPLIVAIQPEITGRGTSKLSSQEQAILNALTSKYAQRVQAGFAELAKASQQLQKAFPKHIKTLNYYRLYENFPNPAFVDAIHLTEEGNQLLAEKLYQAIATLPKLQVTPPKPPK